MKSILISSIGRRTSLISVIKCERCEQRRFDDISQDPESRGEIDSPRDEGRDPKLKHRIGSMNSKNSEFSEIKSKRSRKFGTRLGFKSRGGSSRVESVNVSQIQSGGRPDSRG